MLNDHRDAMPRKAIMTQEVSNPPVAESETFDLLLLFPRWSGLELASGALDETIREHGI